MYKSKSEPAKSMRQTQMKKREGGKEESQKKNGGEDVKNQYGLQ